MGRTLRIIGRLLLFVSGVLLVVNIESVGQALGLNDLATRPEVVSGVWSWLQSPSAYALGLVFFGIGIAAVIDWLAKRWDGSNPGRDERFRRMWIDLDALSDDLGRDLDGGVDRPPMILASRLGAKYTSLEKLGVPYPSIDGNHGRYWYAQNKLFIDALVPLLQEGLVSEARTLATSLSQHINNLEPSAIAAQKEALAKKYNPTPIF